MIRKRKSIAGKKDVKRAIVMLAIAALALFSIIPMPVSAPGNPGAGCTAETKYYGTINGGIYFEQYGWMQFGSMTNTFNDVPDGIKFARVYTGVWGGSPGKGGDFSITVNGHTSPTYSACDPCPNATGCMPYQPLRCDTVNTSECHDYVTGCNVHFISYDVFNDIQTGTNSVTVTTERNDSCPRGGWDGRIYLIALLVVYEDASMPEMTYWINEGAPYMEKDSMCDGPDDHLNISFYFNGTHISNPAKVKYWTLGFPHVANATTEPAYMKLNGNNISKYDYNEGYGGYEVFYRWDNIPPDYLNPSSNLFWYYEPSASYGGYGMYERVNVAVLVVQGQEAVENPDLVITDKWMCWPYNCTICYNLTNRGNSTAPAGHNTTLYVDGIETALDQVPVDLVPNGSYIGCFNYTWAYTPPEDNITVCVDSNNDVDEGNGEFNNCLTNIWKCGDVNDDGKLNMADVMTLWYDYADYPTPGAYTVSNTWAADVNCDGKLNMADVMTLWYDYADYPTPGAYEVNCYGS